MQRQKSMKQENDEVFDLIKAEKKRQANAINLIASENKVSSNVLKALGSVFTNKYAEGYPGKRYYAGNEIVDKVESLCQKRALELFGLNDEEWSVNVQPLSGSPANFATYFSLVPIGEKIMGMTLDSGGHLTHGHPASFSGRIWQSVQYSVDKETQTLDYDTIEELAIKERPVLIVTGYSTYSRIIDFARFRKIADKAGAILMADISHIAGLIAGGVYPSPFPYVDIVTTTTHKTLRGPRGAMIFSRKQFSSKIDRGIIPGTQGGPHINNIAAIAVCLEEAKQDSFKEYAKQVVANAKAFADEFQKLGYKVISGGTDDHLFMLDLYSSIGVTGKEAQLALEKEGIIANMNKIPYDTRTPENPSGIRFGTPTITTNGYKEDDVRKLAKRIDKILRNVKQTNTAN